MKKCCFAGHSKIYTNKNSIYGMIKNKAEELITKESVKEFYVGNYGAFDRIAASVIRELKKTYSDILLILVIPYLTKEINEYRKEYQQKYDYILICDIPEKTPKRYHIIKTNEYMVDNSDYLICFIEHSWGGAAKTLEYAKKKKHITIFNLVPSTSSQPTGKKIDT